MKLTAEQAIEMAKKDNNLVFIDSEGSKWILGIYGYFSCGDNVVDTQPEKYEPFTAFRLVPVDNKDTEE